MIGGDIRLNIITLIIMDIILQKEVKMVVNLSKTWM